MLLIDIGNSRIKWAQWKNNQMTDYLAFEYQPENLNQLLSQHLGNGATQPVYVCSVAGDQINQLIDHWFSTNWTIKAHRLKSKRQQLGVTSAYADAGTLGADRWFAMLAAYQRHKSALCVIDCGTAVTLDVIDADGQHIGGLIMPGMRMMQQALLSGAQEINAIDGQVSILASNTQDAVAGGCAHMLAGGLDGLVKKYRGLLGPGLVCLITGGDGEKIANALESDCHYDRDLILYGLQIAAEAGE